MPEQQQALQVLKHVNFDWTMHIKSVWDSLDTDVEIHHKKERDAIFERIDKLKKTDDLKSPLGLIISGPAGSGKTHLLGVVRQYAMSLGINFILVDMTDVRDFWEIALQGYLTSLQEVGANGIEQFKIIIDCLIKFTGKNVPANKLAKAPENSQKNATNAILSGLARSYKKETLLYQDLIRSLILLNSEDFVISGIGYNWLQGLEIDADDKAKFGFKSISATHLSEVVQGLSWIMNLHAPTILCLDQMDAIVTQHHFASGHINDNELTDEQLTSRSIIEGIGGGLMALRDKTSRTLTLVSCLRSTWDILNQEVVKSVQDRFEKEISLKAVLNDNIAHEIVKSRLDEVYRQENFSPPYPTWPFSLAFFKGATKKYPRKILQVCSQHRDRFLANGKVVELTEFNPKLVDPPPKPTNLQHLDDLFKATQDIDIAHLLDEKKEDESFAEVLRFIGECLLLENPLPDNIDSFVETTFPGGKGYPVLHARIRLVFRSEGDREKHLCLRAIQRSNANSYKARLRAAMTASGIDHALQFRKLGIIRTQERPGGEQTQRLTQTFEDKGGVFLFPSHHELKQVRVLQQLWNGQHSNFKEWMRERRPISQLPCLIDIVNWLFSGIELKIQEPSTSFTNDPVSDAQDSATAPRTSSNLPIETADPPLSSSETTASEVGSPDSNVEAQNVSGIGQENAISPGMLPVGARLIGTQTREEIEIPLENLTKHTVILAGSGSGKTVLIKRMIEEAALQGIPSIVVDGANDLTRMGDRWPTIPEPWNEIDQQKATLYQEKTTVIVWTPGRQAGNPLNLEPLPNFKAIASEPDELEQAIDMARDSLQNVVASGKSATAKVRQGVLRKALEYFAKSGGGRLEDFALMLSDLPPDAVAGITKVQKHAQSMADLLNAEIANNPLLRQSGTPMNPATLLGVGDASPSIRLSILNLVGLAGLSAQQQFLNQLAMTLFTWIKKNPAPKGMPLRGLLVIDEAKDFVPSGSNTSCKASLNRLAAQARKYGLGLVFATPIT